MKPEHILDQQTWPYESYHLSFENILTLTNHEINYAWVNNDRHQSERQDITRHFSQEVHRYSVEPIRIFMQEQFPFSHEKFQSWHGTKYLIHCHKEYNAIPGKHAVI